MQKMLKFVTNKERAHTKNTTFGLTIDLLPKRS